MVAAARSGKAQDMLGAAAQRGPANKAMARSLFTPRAKPALGHMAITLVNARLLEHILRGRTGGMLWQL